MKANDDDSLTHLIERLELFEERVSIRLNALYAFRLPHGGWVSVNGELHPLEGEELKHDVELVLDVYGQSGLLIGSNTRSFRSESFFGFETFTMGVIQAGKDCVISKIRLYPKALSTPQTKWWVCSK